MRSPMEDGWNEWSRHVLAELERLGDEVCDLNKQVAKLHTVFSVLNYKSSVFGIIGGAIPVIVALAYLIVTGKLP